MIIRFENLKKSLAEAIYPVYLIEGEDAFFRERAVASIKQAALKEPDFNYTRFNGSDIKAEPDKLLMDLRSFPFMSDYRVVEVSDWQPTAAELKGDIKKYFEDPVKESVLVIVNKGKCEALKKFEKIVVVDCGKADLDMIIKYVRFKAGKAELIISNTAAKMIADYSLYDMSKIDKELDKLIDYSKGSVEITPEAIDNIVTKETDYKIYEIVGFIAKKNYSKVYEILQEVNTPAEKQQVFVSLYYHFRRMFYASVHKGSERELAQYLSEKEYTMRMAKEQAARFSPKRLKDVVGALSSLDADFKSGRISLDNAYDLAIFDILTGENR